VRFFICLGLNSQLFFGLLLAAVIFFQIAKVTHQNKEQSTEPSTKPLNKNPFKLTEQGDRDTAAAMFVSFLRFTAYF
jgi:hypothetical protein